MTAAASIRLKLNDPSRASDLHAYFRRHDALAVYNENGTLDVHPPKPFSDRDEERALVRFDLWVLETDRRRTGRAHRVAAVSQRHRRRERVLQALERALRASTARRRSAILSRKHSLPTRSIQVSLGSRGRWVAARGQSGAGDTIVRRGRPRATSASLRRSLAPVGPAEKASCRLSAQLRQPQSAAGG